MTDDKPISAHWDESVRTSVLADVEAQWHNQEDAPLETSLSINDWADRIKGATVSAHALARAGDANGEYATWAEIAGIAASRMAAIHNAALAAIAPGTAEAIAKDREDRQ